MKIKKSSIRSAVIIISSVLVAALIFISILFQSKDKQFDTDIFFGMDSYVSIVGGYESRDEIKKIFTDSEQIFDCHSSTSEVYKLNKNKTIKASEKLKTAVNRILDLNKTYGSSADITIGAVSSLWNINGKDSKVPSDNEIDSALKTTGFENIKINENTISLENNCMLDFGSAAKGAVLDYIKEFLDSKKSEKAIISVGSSSILLYGDEKFSVKISSPEGIESENIGILHTPSGFVSTSGGYNRYVEIDGEKYIHIMDTQTGRPSQTDLTSVTVFCQSGIDSDFMATLIFADGTEKLNKYLNCEDFKIVAVDENKNIYVSDGLDFKLLDNNFNLKSKS